MRSLYPVILSKNVQTSRDFYIGLFAAEPDTLRVVTVAWLTHSGSYVELGIAYHALLAWAQEHGHEQRGPMREMYMNDPSTTPTKELRTEVVLPVTVDGQPLPGPDAPVPRAP